MRKVFLDQKTFEFLETMVANQPQPPYPLTIEMADYGDRLSSLKMAVEIAAEGDGE